MFLKVAGNVPEGRFRLGVHLKHQPYMVGGYWVGNHLFCADTFDYCRLQLITVWGLPAHVKTFQAPGVISVRHALLDCLTFKLCEYDTDIQHGPSHRGRGVEFFGGGNKLHIVLLKQLHHVRKNKKKLGRSIEERPKEIDQRNEFGHWECDLVLGHKTKDDQVLLTLSERMSREFLIIRIPDKTSVSVMQAFKMLQKQYSEHWNDIFKTITTDNGSEFADLANLEEVSKTLVYYAHPYTSCDKGTVERHNGLIRRFIPKGDCINNYSFQQIIDIETWCNSLPRKILAYHTPDEIFERELDKIYQTA